MRRALFSVPSEVEAMSDRHGFQVGRSRGRREIESYKEGGKPCAVVLGLKALAIASNGMCRDQPAVRGSVSAGAASIPSWRD